MRTFLVVVCILLVQCTSTETLFESGSPVVKLTTSNFDELVLSSGQWWLVEFYAPWCGHCKEAAPQFEKASKIAKGIFNIGAVDVTENTSLGERYGVKGYPTIKLFGPNKDKPIDYEDGNRSFDKLVGFGMAELKKEVKRRIKEYEPVKADEL